MKLYNYFRSSTSFRVRIALNLKGLAYDYHSVHLLKGDHRGAAYLAINPQGGVPSLELADGRRITQSLAILEYLEETTPEPPLLPADPLGRARVRSLAYGVACDIHPLNNLRVLVRLREMGQDEAGVAAWARHWIGTEFAALEQRLAQEPETGRFCHGDSPGLADICLVPQVVGAARFDCDLAPYPTIRRINEACLALEAFAQAHPSRQPDTES